jgi:hypothetical protein
MLLHPCNKLIGVISLLHGVLGKYLLIALVVA